MVCVSTYCFCNRRANIYGRGSRLTNEIRTCPPFNCHEHDGQRGRMIECSREMFAEQKRRKLFSIFWKMWCYVQGVVRVNSRGRTRCWKRCYTFSRGRNVPMSTLKKSSARSKVHRQQVLLTAHPWASGIQSSRKFPYYSKRSLRRHLFNQDGGDPS